MAKSTRAGPRSRKSRKQKKAAQGRKGLRPMSPASTHGAAEQDAKRRIGQHTGAGEPPLMKK
ncbi:MAG TPA: hypothetical protein VGH50_20805 [Candidatus Binatia bacterium]|jgi:hypothetical protein